MLKILFRIVLIVHLVIPPVMGQHQVVKNNLKEEWLIYSAGRFTAYKGEAVTTIYFEIDPSKFIGDYLVLFSAKPFAVFLNNTLVVDREENVRFPVDSLAKRAVAGQLFIAIYQEPRIQSDLVTQLISEIKIPEAESNAAVVWHDNGLHNFMIVATVLLFLFLLIMFRYNPKLVADYLTAATFFSFRESEDHPMFNRMWNTTNMLAYLYAALLISFILVQMPVEVNQRLAYPDQFSVWVLNWLLASGALLVLLFSKAFFILVFSVLFNIKELTGFQFFNFVRYLFFVFGLLMVIMVVQYFITGSHFFNTPMTVKVVHVLLLGWIALIFFKLVNKAGHSVIHLFLYICATEIIPFLILIKVYK
ncbi:MAG: DUF4271 domain-containing protein [Flammeovirgaceae bacterium]|nr:MAG: DUF4271 domain-containing protein [Flammeovirgaceae bacterium]